LLTWLDFFLVVFLVFDWYFMMTWKDGAIFALRKLFVNGVKYGVVVSRIKKNER